jgi:inorganic pyrophosphatase
MDTPLEHRPHPWHGLDPGARFPEIVRAYIEMVPTDGVKYEIDKHSGYLKVDRPQRFSSFCPTLYGFVPQTYCSTRVAAHVIAGGPQVTRGDGDPLDICVLSERAISHGDIVVQAIPIGGLRMIDGDEADDKIIAVLEGDAVYGSWLEIEESPAALVERLRHYFLTYKLDPESHVNSVEIAEVYDAAEARAVIDASRADYAKHFV